MDRKAEEFRTRLLATFKVEAGEHIRALSSGLLELEQSSPGEHAAVLETIFREAHSLKGAARAVNVSSIESICQSLEGVFSSWQRKDIVPSPSLFDLLQRAASFLEEILLSLEAGSVPVDTSLATSLIESLEKARKGVEPLSPPHSEPPSVKSELSSRATAKGKSLQLDTVRIPVARLDALLWEAEELLSAKLSVSQRAADARAIRGSFAQWKKTRAEARPYLRLLSHESNDDRNGPGEGKKKRQDQLRRFLTLLEQDDASFNALEGRFGALEKSAQRDQRAIERTVNQLLESMKKIVMLPASSLLESFPKLVRDLALEQGKPVELVIQGAEIEVDRRILESMKDPLRHLVRNCVDHGIESAIERERTGKPTRGSIIISLRRKDSDKVELLISDDGAGIQKEKIRTTALKVGACSPDE